MYVIVGFLLVFAAFDVESFSIRNTNELLIAETKYGKIQGRERISVGSSTKFYSFEGIPFAKPPVNELRFEPPQPVDDWEHVLVTNKSVVSCVQTYNSTAIGSEDCLYLNVYTPVLPSNGISEPLPVMAWIYGGGFEAGSNAYEVYGTDYLVEKGVIVVTINYRLGIFGFLSTEDKVVPGNNGLKDQILALKWVRDNIRHFGGNPKKITVFGQSAGSSSVSYLIQSPLAKGLFQQSILQSGVSLSLFAKARNCLSIALAVGTNLGINTTNTSELVEELKKINSTELQTAAKAVSVEALMKNPLDAFIFAPVIEPEHSGAVMSDKSHKLLRVGHFNAMPTMLGYTSLEGYYEIDFYILAFFAAMYDNHPEKLVPIDMNIENADTLKTVGKLIKEKYFGKNSILFSGNSISTYISEDQFVRPIQEFARQMLAHNPVYFYRFAFQGTLSGLENRTLDGVAHSEDMAYLFNTNREPTEDDSLIRERMTTMWTNFAKYGNPTPVREALFENKLWLPADAVGFSNLVYLDINKNLTVGVNPDSENMNFWRDLYEKYAQGFQDTY